jgi:hypothetical protein
MLSPRLPSHAPSAAHRQHGGVQEKGVIIVLVGLLVLGFSVANNFVEKSKVIGLLNDTLSQGNVHAIHDLESTKKALEDGIIAKVGADREVEVYLYHFEPEVRISDLKKPDAYPKLAGVTKVGDYLTVSTLVARAWWVQKEFWYKEKDVHVTKFLILPPGRVGPAYGQPPGDLDFVMDPAIIIDSQR